MDSVSRTARSRRSQAPRWICSAVAGTDSVVAGASLLEEIYESSDLPRLLSHRLFAATPAIFEGAQEDWVEWRCELAAGLGVDDHSILIAGSAGFGVSLDPDGGFSAFGPRSDVDVAVLSHRHFDLAWFE